MSEIILTEAKKARRKSSHARPVKPRWFGKPKEGKQQRYPVRVRVSSKVLHGDWNEFSAMRRWLDARKIWIRVDHLNFSNSGADDRWVKIYLEWSCLRDPRPSRKGRGNARVHLGDAMVYKFGRQDDAALFKLFFG